MIVIYTLLFAIVVFFGYYKWSFLYFKRKNIPYKEPSFPLGNISLKKPFFIAIDNVYKKIKQVGEKHAGFYILTKPFYMIIDPDIIRKVLAKDFSHFVDRGIFSNEKDDPLSAHLFSLEGMKWKHMRAKLTPTFTSGKMKMMFRTLVKCGEQMENELAKFSRKEVTLDVKDFTSRFTIDVIGSCAFGIDCNTFENPNSEFAVYGRKIFTLTSWEQIKAFMTIQFPKLCKNLRVVFNKPDVTDFFLSVIRNTIKYREENNVTRKDFLQLLLDLKDDETENLSFNEIAANCFLFFAAGFETSSTTMSFCLYELAGNQDIQDKLREEIRKVLSRNKGELTYEAMNEMKYLNCVIEETLRKYPPVGQLIRKCTQEYTVEETGVTIYKDESILIPVYAIHKDPEYYPEPEKFTPDRFLEEEKSKRHPFTYLPFGEGPRNCIGSRFGLMQTKVGLIAILKNFKLTTNEYKELKMNPFGFIIQTEENIKLFCEKAE